MFEVAVIEDPAAAEASLDPMRTALLAELVETELGNHARRPGRAAPAEGELPPAGAGAARAGRAGRGAAQGQHDRAGDAGDAPRRTSSPRPRWPGAPDPARSPDRLSARWLLALAARLVRDVGALHRRARPGRQADRDVRARRRGPVRHRGRPAAFAEELAGAVTGLVAKYHDGSAEAAARTG